MRRLACALPGERRREAAMTVGLLVISALAEALSLGAVFPFLAVLTDPDAARALPLVGDLIRDLPAGTNPLSAAAIAFLMLLVVSGGLRLYLTWRTLALVQNTAYDMALIAFRKVIRQPYSYHLSQGSSALISGFDMIYSISFTFLQSGIQALSSAIVAVLLMLALVVIDPVLAAISAVVLVGAYLATSLAVRRTLMRNSTAFAIAWNERVKRIQEASGGIRNIILDHIQPEIERPFQRAMEALRRTLTVSSFIGHFPRIMIEIIAFVVIALLVLYSAGAPGGLVSMVPTLGAIAACGHRLLPVLQATYVGWSQMLGNKESLGQVLFLLELPDQPVIAPRADLQLAPTRRLELEKVCFSFQPGRPVLKDISLTISRGERIGIVGPTGAGKSTLMDLLLGLLMPTSGQIRINGKVLDPAGVAAWQHGVAHVPQSIFLADDSLAANIAFGTPADEIDLERVRLAASHAGIGGFIDGLDEGYDTVCGERGIRLSGGQRQRIGIARALYKRASLLILDEATSALDTETEREVIAAIGGLSSEITVIMVAHRLSTLSDCDRIVHLENGEITRIDERARATG